MNIKILYDNTAKEGFVSGWGFSALIDDNTLFDTGENLENLLANMKELGVHPKQIKRVVISHEDWDHIGGIDIMSQCNHLDVYLPAGASCELKNKIKNINPDTSICEVVSDTNIDSSKFVTATLGDKKKEISLVASTAKGLVLVTGCAHPGLEVIMKKAAQRGNIHSIVGGFHGFDKLQLLNDVKMILPCHCTQKINEIKTLYPDNTLTAYAGFKFDIG